jgi:hypothetical protein
LTGGRHQGGDQEEEEESAQGVGSQAALHTPTVPHRLSLVRCSACSLNYALRKCKLHTLTLLTLNVWAYANPQPFFNCGKNTCVGTGR